MSAPSPLAHDWFPVPLPPNVVIGERSWLYSSYAFLHYRSERPCGVRIGHDSGLYDGTYFELGERGEVEIGHFCTLNGTFFSTNGSVSIGDYVLIAQDVVFADSFAPISPHAPRERQHLRNEQAPIAEMLIGDDVWIGARAVLLPGTRLGSGAIVGAGAVIDFHVPPYAIVAGNPAKIVGWAPPTPESER
jgi:acetyltransferase-like isoleucine patch superfamily enzyme